VDKSHVCLSISHETKCNTMALQASISRLLENDLDLRSADIPADARVLCRIDANVPVSSDGTIQDDTRIQAMLPTVQLLLARGWRVVLCSHLGQPNPAEQSYHELQQRYSLAPVARALSQLLPEGTFTGLVQDCIGSAAEAAAAALLPGQVCKASYLVA
jgi:phosphoglycerate kinase